MGFGKDFIWGAASASYQTEGGAFEDGKGRSIWDVFSHTPGRTFNGQTGDVACDTYHRIEEDLDLLQKLEIPHYRFSISWPRVFPKGSGEISEKGLAFYDRIVNGCLERGITPWVTLYHWDLPLALYRRGGWLNRETPAAFRDYAAFLAKHFKGRVNRYLTINEPQCIVGMGHVTCLHAPGTFLPPEEQFLSWHHVLLAHGLAAEVIRNILPDAQIGIASTGKLCYISGYPAETPEGLAEKTFRTDPGTGDYFFSHQWFLDPLCFGHYPDDPDHPWYAFAASVSGKDLERIGQKPDYIGLNTYNGSELVRNAGGKLDYAEKYPGYPRTSLKWPVTPEVLYWGPRLIYERYRLPVAVVENGQACNDRIFLDGRVHDADRIDFLHRYLLEYKKAAEDGVPLLGYFHWSLTDNLEWHSGYDDRFGLIYIDYRNQTRILKDSALWYRDVIRANGDNL